ncbi:MAG: hypothetical protein ACI9HK_001419 [Pirellulaceae bacterium]|jgi:hypothetical protein
MIGLAPRSVRLLTKQPALRGKYPLTGTFYHDLGMTTTISKPGASCVPAPEN